MQGLFDQDVGCGVGDMGYILPYCRSSLVHTILRGVSQAVLLVSGSSAWLQNGRIDGKQADKCVEDIHIRRLDDMAAPIRKWVLQESQ